MSAWPGAESPLLASLVRHYDELIEYVRRRFGQRGFAQDVVHDVCVRLLERPEPDTSRAPLAMLRRLSHDTAIDRCRSDDARHRWIDSVAILPQTVCPVPDQARVLDAQLEMERLAAAIQAMPRRRRQVFILYKIHELPQAEVAQRMGISLKAVEKHLRLAMAECRTRLERE